jgi:glucan 1,3-beta-glucosidase
VSNHPAWRLQAAGGAALAALIFAAALAGRRKGAPGLAWLGVAAIALAPGILIGWAVANVPLESLAAGDWIRSSVLVALAIAVPLLAAVALMRGEPVPTLASVVARPAERTHGLALALGAALIVLCVVAVQVALGLVFDPRYKDFPFAPLTAAVAPFLCLSMAGARRKGPRGAAETAFAAVLAVCAAYFILNEGFANWQALWLGAVFIGLAAILLRVRAAPG